MASTYYIDLTNGNDSHTGLREPATVYTAEASTSATQICCPSAALVENGNDAYNGDYVWNVTRNLGALITDFVETGHVIIVDIA